MDELKNIKINEEGVFCHYYPDVHWEKPIIVPLSYDKINVYLYSSHNADYLGWIDKGSIWCKKFEYKHFKKSIALNVYI
ncbi:MAG: hypothetical protein B5M53_06285 [Candidatus Cloacimonas sp. 4484_209]|nr:MAG: hypothetical protein B5M53_06285 [Candidatus Cloacimonas sp. 4484_209]